MAIFICWYCQKACYGNKGLAKAWLSKLSRDLAVKGKVYDGHVYRCPGSGKWHVGTKRRKQCG